MIPVKRQKGGEESSCDPTNVLSNLGGFSQTQQCGEGVDVELGKAVLGAERSRYVLTHTPSLSYGPAPSRCLTPKGLHTPAASASANAHLGCAEHTGTLPLKC